MKQIVPMIPSITTHMSASIDEGSLRCVEFFVAHIAMSLNTLSGNPKGWQLYKSDKKSVFEALLFAGVKRHVAPFTNPVTLSYYPQITVNPRTGKILKGYDSINFAVTYKLIEDRLVKFGILQDDRAEFVRASNCYAPNVTQGLPGIRVVIAECGNCPHQDSLI